MKFLLLLLPNFYDIFTLLMIGYAFMLNRQTPFPISFGLVCLLIYAATRIGIFAGKLIQMIIGQPVPTEGEEPANMVAKRLILSFGPQCIFVVICQVILGLTFLPTPTSANLPQTLQKQTAQLQTQNIESNEKETAAENIEQAVENTTVNTTSDKTTDVQNKAEISNPSVSANSTTKNTKKVINSKATKSTQNLANETIVESSQKVAAYVPERTLRSAGINPAEVNVSTTAQQQKSQNRTNQANYNSSATTTAAQNKTSNNNNLHTKRYMGDDNPVSTSWGYYKNTSYPNVNNAAEQVNTVRSYSYNPTKY